MKFFKPTMLATGLLCLLFSCSNLSSKDKPQDLSVAIDKREEVADSAAVPQVADQKQINKQPAPPPKEDWEKKIIKTAAMNIEVKDQSAYNTYLRNKVKDVGGYFAQEEQQQSAYKIENTVTIKVPVDQFDNAITLLSTGAEQILEKKISSQDVTGEIVDTRSRLEAKKHVRDRYLDLLKQAKNMEEILNVQQQVNSIQEEIESAAGRIEYLGHSSAFSTINLTYFQVLNESAVDTEHPSFGTKLSNAFKTGWSWIGDLLIGLISIWPLVLIIFACILLYRRWEVAKTNKRVQ